MTTAHQATHHLTIDGVRRPVVALAYRGSPQIDGDGPSIALRLATDTEIDTGRAADGHPVCVALARPVMAARAFALLAEYDADAFSSPATSCVGDEAHWSAGALLCAGDGEPPRWNATWTLERIDDLDWIDTARANAARGPCPTSAAALGVRHAREDYEERAIALASLGAWRPDRYSKIAWRSGGEAAYRESYAAEIARLDARVRPDYPQRAHARREAQYEAHAAAHQRELDGERL